MSIEYLDFELEIGRGDGRTYPLAVLQSPAGNLRSQFNFTLSELELNNRILALQNALLRSGGQQRKVLRRDEETVRTFGHELFSILFQDDVRSLFFENKRLAIGQGKYLRLKLRILDPQLATLPWEYLFDTRQSDYLCLSHGTPLVRYLEVPQPPQPLTITPPLRILGMIASPTDQLSLNVAREKERLEQALTTLVEEGLVELTWLPGQTWRDLHRATRPNQGPWHVFHFIGHGGFDKQREEGLLAFANRQGKSDLRTATEVARLLSSQTTLRLALLNACEGAYAGPRDIFSSTAATLVQQGIPAVIAMQYEITDRAAIEFSQSFYDAITADLPVDSAVTDARRAVSLAINHALEWGIPVLFMRAPDGVLFHLDDAAPSQEPAHQSAISEPLPTVVEEESQQAEPEYLSGVQIQELLSALLDAYNPSILRQMVRIALNQRLDEIVSGETFDDQVFNLIDWAERTDSIPELIAKAQAYNPSNQRLRQVCLDILGEAVEADIPEQPEVAEGRRTVPAVVKTENRPIALPTSPIAFEWILISAGAFPMGSTDEEDLAHDDEKPQETIYLPDYYIAKVPVTNAQYKMFVEAKQYQAPSHWEEGQIPQGKENHPVVCVSWHDAMAFCDWAGVQLASEAQWEKAARGITGQLYPWGNHPHTDKLCNFRINVGDTTPVDHYPDGASPYGCLDMAGNVWEWTSSQFQSYPYDPNDGREGPSGKSRRTLCGGSWSIIGSNVRGAARFCGNPSYRLSLWGYRVMSPGSS